MHHCYWLLYSVSLLYFDEPCDGCDEDDNKNHDHDHGEEDVRIPLRISLPRLQCNFGQFISLSHAELLKCQPASKVKKQKSVKPSLFSSTHLQKVKMKTLILCLAVVGIAVGFQCPEPHGFFAHPVECDGYYECKNNAPTKKVCEDGLLFDTSNPNLEKCDLPFSVDCGDRTELQPAQSTIQCPRKNGFFSHEDPSVCDRFYNCVNGLANVQHCSSGLIYDDYTGTCTWPADVQRPECSKDKIKKEVLPDGFSCPNGEVVGPNGRPLPHPTYPHPEDCQKFYICQLGSRPQLGSCPSGTVYSETSFRCEDPENVPGCEKWFDEA